MAYRNNSGWDDSGAYVHVRLGQGDTYRHAGVEYANDGLPIYDPSRDEVPAPRPQREPRAGGTTRPSLASNRPRAETQPIRQTLRNLYEEENPSPPRPRYTEEDERREYNAIRSAQNARDQSSASQNYRGLDRRDPTPAPRQYYPQNNRPTTTPPALPTYPCGPSPGSYQFYLNDNEYHNTAHLTGSIARARGLFSPMELIQYREYDEDYYAGRRRSLIHGGEGYYGDNLRHERYIAGGPHHTGINPRRRQPFSDTIPPPRSSHSALDGPSPMEIAEAQGRWAHRSNVSALDGPSPMEIAEAQGRWAHRGSLYGLSPMEAAEAQGRFAHRDSLGRRSDGRYDDGDPCPNASAHTGRHGICFARKDAGYPG
ncbi:MAG: hypothetical protein OHK93_004922 [Ramalina farinacea]|uniref:Uncharacterized protein n=1 Tax=Ramalina farinacea TaxID=258253 RepID=A0AA43QV46_9LECA|nr:hypothetical protein [Ramalina farinacea]